MKLGQTGIFMEGQNISEGQTSEVDHHGLGAAWNIPEYSYESCSKSLP
jgi:hypothetical protein